MWKKLKGELKTSIDQLCEKGSISSHQAYSLSLYGAFKSDEEIVKDLMGVIYDNVRYNAGFSTQAKIIMITPTNEKYIETVRSILNGKGYKTAIIGGEDGNIDILKNRYLLISYEN